MAKKGAHCQLVDFLTATIAIAATRDSQTVMSTTAFGDLQRANAVTLDDAITPRNISDIRNVLGNVGARAGLSLALVAGNGPPRCTLVNVLG